MTLKETIRELRALNEPVPHPLQLPTAEQVAQIQVKLGIKFHPDFRKYLLEASDVVYGTLEPVTITGEGGQTELSRVAPRAWESGVPRRLVPVCEDNADYYCMDEQGQVVFWSHNGPTDETWPDLATWIQEVWIEEG
jgi:hypothetical protein